MTDTTTTAKPTPRNAAAASNRSSAAAANNKASSTQTKPATKKTSRTKKPDPQAKRNEAIEESARNIRSNNLVIKRAQDRIKTAQEALESDVEFLRTAKPDHPVLATVETVIATVPTDTGTNESDQTTVVATTAIPQAVTVTEPTGPMATFLGWFNLVQKQSVVPAIPAAPTDNAQTEGHTEHEQTTSPSTAEPVRNVQTLKRLYIGTFLVLNFLIFIPVVFWLFNTFVPALVMLVFGIAVFSTLASVIAGYLLATKPYEPKPVRMI